MMKEIFVNKDRSLTNEDKTECCSCSVGTAVVQQSCFSKTVKGSLLPYPCSYSYVDINFGDRLYSKEKRPGSFFSFQCNLSPNLIST